MRPTPSSHLERGIYTHVAGWAFDLGWARDTHRKRWVTTSTIYSRTRFLLLEMLSSLRIAYDPQGYLKHQIDMASMLMLEIMEFRSARIPQAPDRYGFYVDVEEYELGDLNEPPNYKAALLDPEFDK
ncbi:hypothetical protein Tco_1562093 [Tanacetum coccineum]